MSSVQVRLTGHQIGVLDSWVRSGRFRSRSDALKSLLQFEEEREKTRSFLTLLEDRSREVRERKERLVPLE